MADYIYLIENRLSPAQQRALSTVRNLVRAKDLTLFLTGGAVRDLSGGASVRDLDISVQGDISVLRGDLEASGAIFEGEDSRAQTQYFRFAGGVRVEISAAMSVSYPKPGTANYEPSGIAEDLRRRDFTANAMALSLNEGSYGLLMDPLNGVADIENRELRLVSNYGFLEDPSRMIRAARLSSRLGWQMEEKTQQRYLNAKEEDLTGSIDRFRLGYELEEIFHEEDPLRIMRALEAEGWLKVLAPELISGKANEGVLAELRERQGQLQTQGILSDGAALAFPLLIAKLPAKDVEALKKRFARPGFAAEIDALEERTRELQSAFSGKEAGTPSAAWRVLHEAEPNLVLSMFHTSKSGTVQSRIKTFLNDSPGARQRLPYALLLEMRITPDLPGYHDLLDKLFFQLMDGKLETVEELKAFLEPYSPPAPPPPLNLRRARAKKEPRASRAKAKKAPTVVEQEEAVAVSEGLMASGTLTGPDRGPEPSLSKAMEGNVAPLATGETEGKPAKAKRSAKIADAVTVTTAELAEVGSQAAKKLTATPAPAAEEKALEPHPEAARDIARAGKVLIPQQQQGTRKGAEAPPLEKSASVQAPVRKAAKANAVQPEEKAAAAKKAAPAKAAVRGGAVAAGKPAPKKEVRSQPTRPAAASPAKKATLSKAKPGARPVAGTAKKAALKSKVKAVAVKVPSKHVSPAGGKAKAAGKAAGKRSGAVPGKLSRQAAKAPSAVKATKAGATKAKAPVKPAGKASKTAAKRTAKPVAQTAKAARRR